MSKEPPLLVASRTGPGTEQASCWRAGAASGPQMLEAFSALGSDGDPLLLGPWNDRLTHLEDLGKTPPHCFSLQLRKRRPLAGALDFSRADAVGSVLSEVSVESEVTRFEEGKGETPGFLLFVSVAGGSIQDALLRGLGAGRSAWVCGWWLWAGSRPWRGRGVA